MYCSISLLKILRNLYGKSFQDRSSLSLLQVKNEWEVLFDSIHKFIREINYYQEKMEERVREVTKDLEEKNKMLQNLLERRKLLITNMAHELKTPLTSVKGSIDYLKRQLEIKQDLFEKGDFERLWEFLEISQKNVKRLIDLFNALIDLEKAEANLLELEITAFNLRELIKETIDYLKGLASSKGLAFRMNLREDLLIYADKEKIAMVLSNLIHNAIKYSPQGGEVTISAYEREDKIRVEVEDQGRGISEEEVERLFERFYKRDSRGTGLGLAIAKAYVEAHFGKIGAIAKERGALFYFEIPQTLGIIQKYEEDSRS
jgi:signal transduction histidine kinase